MNCSDNMNRKQLNAYRRKQWFRRMFTVALFMGLIIGFVLGRLSVAAFEETAVEPEPDSITSVIPVDPAAPVDSPEPEEPASPVLLGTYRVTAYCSCEKCCGKWAQNRPNGIVYGASGEELIAGISCASPLPFGTVIEIEGYGEYTVQDRTASWVVEKYGNNLVDIYFDNHEAACEFGLQYLNVYLKGDAQSDRL